MSMELQQLEKQRIKLYKDYLRQEFQVKNKRNKEQQKQAVQRDSVEIKQKINQFKQQDLNRKLQRRRIASSLNDDNQRVKYLRDSQIYLASPQQNPNQKSFISRIDEENAHRYQKMKETLTFQKQQNWSHQKFRKSQEQRIKQIERAEEERHAERVKQQQQKSLQYYNQILKKHSQDMKAFQRVKQLAEYEEQYKTGQLRKFQDQQQIFAHVKRNQTEIRKKIYKDTQQQIKKQIDQFNNRKNLDNSERKVGHQLSKSLLADVLFRQPKNYAFYLNDLKNQMTQKNFKDNQQIAKRKQKIQVGGIFGGKPTHERYRQINYVDRKLGLTNQVFSPQKFEAQQKAQQRYQKGGIPAKYSGNRNDQSKQKVNRSYQDAKSTRNEVYHQGSTEILKNTRNQPEKPNSYRSQSLPREQQRNHAHSQMSNGRKEAKKSYFTYDLITGKNRYYQN